jgi:phosphoglycolate phosphatase
VHVVTPATPERPDRNPAPSLLFDLDGCIVDSLGSIVRCWTETLPEFGLPVPPVAQIRAHVGPPVHEAAQAFAPGADEATIAAIVAAYRARSARATDVEPFAGMPELLGRLNARGWVLGIATSKSIEVALPLLEHLELTPLFTVIEGTRVDEIGTDKATVVGRALARLAPLVPLALVGDREHDVHGAHTHGLAAIGVLWGYGTAQELNAAGADVLVSDPDELGRHLQRSIAGV